VEQLEGDRADRPSFEESMRGREFDVVYDMISYTPEDAWSAVRVFGGKVGHFIHVSTVMTYGPPFDGVGLDETAPCNGAADGGYGQAKAAADAVVLEAFRSQGFPATVVKPSLTFGPGRSLLRQADWWPGWIQRLRDGLEIISVGDGTNLFQFLPASDAGEAFAGLAGKQAAIGQTLNLVHPEATTWDSWIRSVASVLGVEARLVHVPRDILVAVDRTRFGRLDTNFAHTQVFSCAKLSAILPDWRPVTPRSAEIACAVEWMDQNVAVDASDPYWAAEDQIIQSMTELPAVVRSRISS
jgi:nucleoside-diphosphate-sugar epimerase